MKYMIYKLSFPNGVHLGERSLDESNHTFKADTLFSALYIEAMKSGQEDELLEACQRGALLLSDAFPYIGDTLYLPKPVIYVESGKDSGDSVLKKAAKNLKYIPMDKMTLYISGQLQVNEEKELLDQLGRKNTKTSVGIYGNEETEPYHVGIYYFNDGNGLYVIIGYEDQKVKVLFESLIQALGYSGIGGKRTSGLGKFAITGIEELSSLGSGSGKKMAISISLPKEAEIGNAVKGASYLLVKRSGFIQSSNYSKEYQKKKDFYAFDSGSCFENEYQGDIFDVSEGGCHSVYRYAKGMFWRL